jgi:crotonobetainyl-CoA:carnitine CoA-transferase CaiB-like acyl-CoA transferase
MDGVPAIGEHTQSILRQLGRTDQAIEALRARGAI